ncbi:hypothetical protein FSP39_022032 [Pinctada imbricata]|uniref:Integrase catalytic domain-containing protein n=1 Tax=Pinctada imbricata TaxID=66713 RepID=A0AA88Y9C8_PINIB|nr:hypothetical protein FSP39_022032 [Pinctada imbricata]
MSDSTKDDEIPDSGDHGEGRERRQNTKSEKGTELFNEMCMPHESKLRVVEQDLNSILNSSDIEQSSREEVKATCKDLTKIHNEFQLRCTDYLNLLSRHNTDDSAKKQAEFSAKKKQYSDNVVDFLKTNRILQRSNGSITSWHSSASNATIVEKQIRVNAAKARLKFVKREAELKRKAALIENEMAELDAYKEAAVSQAELEAVEYQDDDSLNQEIGEYLDVKPFMGSLRESAPEFVPRGSYSLHLPTFSNFIPQSDVASPISSLNLQDQKLHETAIQPEVVQPAVVQPEVTQPKVMHPAVVQPAVVQPKVTHPAVVQFNASSPAVVQQTPIVTSQVSQPAVTQMSLHTTTPVTQPSIASQNDFMTDFAKFWFKKDLVTKVDPFDDKPEHYLSWKTSFKRVISELNVTASEELDLLIKWLGPSSSSEARNIKACFTHNPTLGRENIWARLEEKYGAPSLIEASIRRKLDNFRPVGEHDGKGLYKLCDILNEIQALSTNHLFKDLLAQYNTSSGVSPIICKLPKKLQDKWTTRAFQYKQSHKEVNFPPFTYFLTFLREMAMMYNDPSFSYTQHAQGKGVWQNAAREKKPFVSKKTDVTPKEGSVKSAEMDSEKTQLAEMSTDPSKLCPLHNLPHALNDCERFRKWRLDNRRAFLRQHKICFKCCNSTNHVFEKCDMFTPCKVCKSERHATAMHLYRKGSQGETFPKSGTDNGGEQREVSTSCTTICGSPSGGRSCAKIVLVNVFPNDRPEAKVTVYAIIDDQSDATLAHSELLNALGVYTDSIPYRIKSCAGQSESSGRRAVGFTIQSMDGGISHLLPPMIECDDIPENISEIPTPEVAFAHSHLHSVAKELHTLRSDVRIQLLIGRDLVDVHPAHDQILGPPGTPFAQKLSLGWVVVGDVCLQGRHKPNTINALKTHIQGDGRGTIFRDCDSKVHVEILDHTLQPPEISFKGDHIFDTSRNDNKIGSSVEDRAFLAIMDKELRKNDKGKWTAPLPFKCPRSYLPNNQSQVYKRAVSLDSSLKRNPEKLKKMVEFMDVILGNGAAERAPPITDGRECWYIPIFGVVHPKKPEKVRGVFDSSIVYQGHSLNDSLLSGPNLTNNLLGILLRFRKDEFAIAGDIQLMFYQFCVNENHRDYLRFYWYDQNDPSRPMVEYRMSVHVFGNRPSPAVATYGLKKAVQGSNPDVVRFVHRDFYVDDALTSRPTSAEVIDLMSRTQAVLKAEGDIRLHKIVSNHSVVMDAFPASDLGKDVKDLSFSNDTLLLQHSLGLSWDLCSDNFVFTSPDNDVPFTRRGILSKINSIFDPIGFLCPLTICGKMLLRQMCPAGTDWDDPISDEFHDSWVKWTNLLDELGTLRIPRMFLPSSFSTLQNPDIIVYSDASEKAIAAAAYVKVENQLGFIMGKSKLAPQSGHSIPRLELCGAVLATEIGEFISEHLDIPLSWIKYYTDSKVVLGYIRNKTRRFHTYVSNRVSCIHSISNPQQWSYVPSNLNPSDCATRGSLLDLSILDDWLKGPIYLLKENCSDDKEDYPLINPDEDIEIRKEHTVLKEEVTTKLLPLIDRFVRYSTWTGLVSAMSLLRHLANSFNALNGCHGWHTCSEYKSQTYRKHTEQSIIRLVQKQAFSKEIIAIRGRLSLPKDSRILCLSPFLDEEGLVRVGGRLNNMKDNLGLASVNPIIIPNGHVATLLVRHFHAQKGIHQGRGITEGIIRSEGFWILGAKKLISSVIFHCVTCRKLRRKPQEQKMADLPMDRLTPGPPFTNVGVDVFGPWQVLARKTRGGSAQNKRWAALFTCLTTRAIHIEVLEDMSSSCFINALRRFVALRGPVKLFRSDRGTNFIGAVDHLKVNAINVEDDTVKPYLHENGSVWLFNAPHSSHMGGVWERAIGSARKVLDSMLLRERTKDFSHEVLVTLMAEVCAILNSRPITTLDSDPTNPMVLSPNILLTRKQGDVVRLSDGLSMKDMYSAQWKHVQILSDVFWKKWRESYLNILQKRQKWPESVRCIKSGDLVLLRDKNLHRNLWPVAIVENAIASNDGLVRKATVRVVRDDKHITYTRPISEMALLLEE